MNHLSLHPTLRTSRQCWREKMIELFLIVIPWRMLVFRQRLKYREGYSAKTTTKWVI